MKTIVVSTNSWHFKLASFGSPKEREAPKDICSYVQQMIGSLCFMAFIGCMVIAACVISGAMMAWLIACIVTFTFVEDVAAIPWVLAVLAGSIWLFSLGTKKAAQHSPGFVKDAYVSFRDKVCYRVDYR